MTQQEFYDLEILLGKLRIYLDRRFCIIPEYLQDGYHIATYNEKGEIEDQTAAVSIQKAAEIIKLHRP